jgi:disulfide bond formation protein DsbB
MSILDRVGTRPILALGTVLAVVATSGSLYFSEVMGLIPCELCWVQRIFMYPLVIVLGVAAVEDRASVVRTVLPLSTLGTAVAVYHSYLQYTSTASSCGTVSCSAVQLRILGLSIPNLSLVGFLSITAVSVVLWVGSR